MIIWPENCFDLINFLDEDEHGGEDDSANGIINLLQILRGTWSSSASASLVVIFGWMGGCAVA